MQNFSGPLFSSNSSRSASVSSEKLTTVWLHFSQKRARSSPGSVAQGIGHSYESLGNEFTVGTEGAGSDAELVFWSICFKHDFPGRGRTRPNIALSFRCDRMLRRETTHRAPGYRRDADATRMPRTLSLIFFSS